MEYKVRIRKAIKGNTIITGSTITCRDFMAKLYDINELAAFIRMLVDNHTKFETSFEIKGYKPEVYVYCDEEDQDEFKNMCEILKKEVFDNNENISFLQINAGILQEIYRKY